jgi:hypothetical protein
MTWDINEEIRRVLKRNDKFIQAKANGTLVGQAQTEVSKETVVIILRVAGELAELVKK